MRAQVTFGYPPPFDGNGRSLTIAGEWVEMEGDDVRVDVHGTGDPVVVATREFVQDVGPHVTPGKQVAVWRMNPDFGGEVFGRMVVGQTTEAEHVISSIKALTEASQDILENERHWSLVDVADRAEDAAGLANGVLGFFGIEETGCPKGCHECREHNANIGNEDECEDETDAVKKAAESVVTDGDARRSGAVSLPGRFIQVEYDPSYSGGDYSGWNSDNAYLEMVDGLCEENVEDRFEKLTGAKRENIVSYNFDELYAKAPNGEFVPEDEIDEDES